MVFVGLPVNRPDELSEQKPWGLGFFRWLLYYPQLCGALYYSYIKQPVFHGKVRDPVFFFVAQMLGCVLPGNTGGASRWRPWEVPTFGQVVVVFEVLGGKRSRFGWKLQVFVGRHPENTWHVTYYILLDYIYYIYIYILSYLVNGQPSTFLGLHV